MPRPPEWKVRNAREAWDWLVQEAERRKPPNAPPPTPVERRAHLEAIIAERKRTHNARVEAGRRSAREYRERSDPPWFSRPSPPGSGARRAWLATKPEMDTQVVYVIRAAATGLTKIGTSGKIRKRFAALQAASPDRLELLATFPGGYLLEDDLHEVFSDRRKHGEWFDLGDDPVDLVRRVVTQGSG